MPVTNWATAVERINIWLDYGKTMWKDGLIRYFFSPVFSSFVFSWVKESGSTALPDDAETTLSDNCWPNTKPTSDWKETEERYAKLLLQFLSQEDTYIYIQGKN